MSLSVAYRARTAISLALATMVLAIHVPVANGQLYGVTSQGPTTTLYLMDKATGAATPVVDLSNLSFIEGAGLGELGGTLYASEVDVDPGLPLEKRFGTVNRTTGVFTSLNDQDGDPSSWHGLSGNDAAGVVYVVDSADSQRLKTITPAGVINTIGVTGVNANVIAGLAYDFEHGILYGVGMGGTPLPSLYTFNTSTGTATTVGPLFLGGGPNPFNTYYMGLAYDPTDDTLYLNVADFAPNATDGFYSVNSTTGRATFIGVNGPTNGFGIDGLAYIPEPGMTGALIILAGLLRRRGFR